MPSRRHFLKTISLGLSAATLGSYPSLATASDFYSIPVRRPLKVGFVYVDPLGDIGWTYQQELGRQAMDRALGNAVRSNVVQNIPEARSESVIRELAASGHQLIFTTSFGYMNPTLAVARAFPQVIFEQATGYKQAANMGNYNGRFYEPQYLTGLIAGAMTKTGTIGYILPFPIPEVFQVVDAFTLGLQETRPNATVKTVWVNSWYNPLKERQAALTLADSGADVLVTHTDSPATMQVAQSRGIWAFCQDSNQHQYGPRAQLSGVIDNWGPFYIQTAQQVLAGHWQSRAVWGGLKSGMVELAPLSPLIPAEVVHLVQERKAAIENGSFTIFKGPLYDQQGALKVASGNALDDAALMRLQWFVKGVQGHIG